MPKLSIITINYNNLEGLKRTVESVVNQTWKEFEYIVIDGGSTDGSAAYIESQSEHFDYWVSEKDTGIYNAMNKGIKVATGEYLLFLNSGDELIDIEALNKNHFHLEEMDLIYFDINVISDTTSFIKKYPKFLSFTFLYDDTIHHQSTFIRKSLFNKIGYYDEKLKIVSDWKFFIVALIKENASYKYINATFSNYYLDGISSRVDYTEERKQVLTGFFSGFLLEYEELLEKRDLINKNRYKMLNEIEKSKIGAKIVSAFFRLYIFLFSKKKIKDII